MNQYPESKTLTEAVIRLVYACAKLCMVLGLAFGSFGYLLTTSVAVAKEHRSTLSIFFLNLFLGWTILGWVVAMYWATRNAES